MNQCNKSHLASQLAIHPSNLHGKNLNIDSTCKLFIIFVQTKIRMAVDPRLKNTLLDTVQPMMFSIEPNRARQCRAIDAADRKLLQSGEDSVLHYGTLASGLTQNQNTDCKRRWSVLPSFLSVKSFSSSGLFTVHFLELTSTCLWWTQASCCRVIFCLGISGA